MARPDDPRLKRRPDECPHCGHYLSDEMTWWDDETLHIDIGCGYCDWFGYVILEVVPPDAE